jgi:glutamate synthase (NADPH/NADH) small chain
MILRTSSSHEEGGERLYSVSPQAFEGDECGHIKTIQLVRLEWFTDEKGQKRMREIPGSEMKLPCELVILAMGFVAPEFDVFVEKLGMEELCSTRFGKAIKTDERYMTYPSGILFCRVTHEGGNPVLLGNYGR